MFFYCCSNKNKQPKNFLFFSFQKGNFQKKDPTKKGKLSKSRGHTRFLKPDLNQEVFSFDHTWKGRIVLTLQIFRPDLYSKKQGELQVFFLKCCGNTIWQLTLFFLRNDNMSPIITYRQKLAISNNTKKFVFMQKSAKNGNICFFFLLVLHLHGIWTLDFFRDDNRHFSLSYKYHVSCSSSWEA